MATSIIGDRQREFIRRSYSYTYSVGSDSRYTLTSSNFKDSNNTALSAGISGYTPVSVYRAYSGSANVNVRGVNATTNGNVMYIYNKSGSGVSGDITANVGILWMRNDLVET